MTDRRKPSPSDELLGKARGEAADGEGPDDFTPSSPVDEYETTTPFISEPVAELDHSLDFGDDMTAEEIAAVLDEPGRVEPPVDTPTSPPDSASLPDWARTEPDPGAAPSESVVTSIPEIQRPADAITPSAEVASTPPTQPASLEDEDVWAGGDRWTTPTTQWEEHEARRAEKRQSRFDIPVPRFRPRMLISLATVVFVLGGVLWNYFDGREPIASVAVGDCFIAGDALEIDQVPVVDCERKHDSELFAKVDMAVMGTAYPGDEAMFEWLFARCLEQFPAYVGEPYESSDYYIDMFVPLEDGWSDGDTTGLCTIVLVDGDFNIRTVAGSGRNSGNNA